MYISPRSFQSDIGNETWPEVDLQSVSERRDSVKLVVDMLVVALEGAKKTEIVYKANLNFKQAQKYLGFLLSKGLMAVESSSGKRKVYRTTERGRTFIRRYGKALELIL